MKSMNRRKKVLAGGMLDGGLFFPKQAFFLSCASEALPARNGRWRRTLRRRIYRRERDTSLAQTGWEEICWRGR